MTDRASDSLIISFDNSTHDEAALVVFRKNEESYVMLKGVVGAQADLLYYALTNQSVKISIQEEE